MENSERVVKKGRFLHDGLVFGDVEIVETESSVWPGDNGGAAKRANGDGETSFEIRCTLSTDVPGILVLRCQYPLAPIPDVRVR